MKYLLLIFSLVLVASCTSTKKFPKKVIQEINTFQRKINSEYKNPKESPLTKEDLMTFKGLDFFPIKSEFRVVANFKRTPNEMPFEMKTTTSRTPTYVKYGEVKFRLGTDWFTLDVFQSLPIHEGEYKDYLFFPFRDLSSGEEAYGGGRYIDLTIPKDDKIVIDFNQAYNPYCAYNHKYSCPIPPPQNFINKKILAGVRKFNH